MTVAKLFFKCAVKAYLRSILFFESIKKFARFSLANLSFSANFICSFYPQTAANCRLHWLLRVDYLQKTSERNIPHFKQGKKLYFKRSELDEWLTELKITTHAEIEKEATDYIIRKGKFRR